MFWRPSSVTENVQLVEIYQAIYNSRGSEYFFYWGRFVEKPSPSFRFITILTFGREVTIVINIDSFINMGLVYIPDPYL